MVDDTLKGTSMWVLILAVSLMFTGTEPTAAHGAGRQANACGWFRETLEPIPHQSLSLDSGAHDSIHDGRTYTGCTVRFETNDSLRSDRQMPNLDALEGSELYRLGWRADNSIGADGPGTSLFAIRRTPWLCVVRESQPAYLDDSGEIIRSETLQITVQCRQQ